MDAASSSGQPLPGGTLEVRVHPRKGRTLHTTRLVKAGEIVLVEAPTLLLVSPDLSHATCATCLRAVGPSGKRGGRTSVHYTTQRGSLKPAQLECLTTTLASTQAAYVQFMDHCPGCVCLQVSWRAPAASGHASAAPPASAPPCPHRGSTRRPSAGGLGHSAPPPHPALVTGRRSPSP